MSISTIVIGFIVVVAVFVIVEMRRRQVQAFREAKRELKFADEMEPTHTGKFRVQEMLKRAEEAKRQSEQETLASDDQSPLPDPFGTGSFKNPENK